MTHARLAYLMGPSGSGKDSVLDYARERLSSESVSSEPGVVFAHRYITRPGNQVGENHIALTEAEFAARLHEGLFALHWSSHGYHYGIGIEINQWLGKGLTVVVNGSRAYYPEALAAYPDMLPVTLSVNPATLARRLRQRGRESEIQIQHRLHRLAGSNRSIPGPVINNDGTLEEAGEAFLGLLRERGVGPCK